MAEKGIQEKISWVSHPLLAEASEQLEKGQLDAAALNLKALLLEKPDSVDAYRMLHRRIGIFASLPLRSLDQIGLQRRLEDIGRIPSATAKAELS